MNRLLTFAKPALRVLPGLLMAASAVNAQEAAQTTRQRAELAAPKPSDTAILDKLLLDAAALLDNGQPARAYALLEAHEFNRSGDVRFDYLIGIAALDSGKPDQATLAFERVLAVNPEHAAARLDMARAYYQLGDLPRARTEFAAALGQGPSAALRANIQKYLDQIDARKEGQRTRLSGYAELGLGWDSNINLSSSESQLKVFVAPSWFDATLAPANLRMADSYSALAAGLEVTHGLTADWSLYAGADFRKRNANELVQFTSSNVDLRAGTAYETGKNRLRLGLSSGNYTLGGSQFSGNAGFNAEWRHALSPSNQLHVFAQSLQYRYVDVALRSNDFDQTAHGLGWAHTLASGRSSLYGGVYLGAEKDVSPLVSAANPNGGRIDGAKSFWGLRVSGQSAISEKAGLFVTSGMQIGDYSKTNSYFLRQRSDRLFDLTLGLNWFWDRQWTLRPQLSYMKNDSNITIYGYDKVDVSLTVRRDFR